MEMAKRTVDLKTLSPDIEVIINENTRISSQEALAYIGPKTEARVCPVCGELFIAPRMCTFRACCHECRAKRADDPLRPTVEQLILRRENRTRREAAEAKRAQAKPPTKIASSAERITARRNHLMEVERQHMESRAVTSAHPNDLWQAEIYAMVNANHERREKELKKT